MFQNFIWLWLYQASHIPQVYPKLCSALRYQPVRLSSTHSAVCQLVPMSLNVTLKTSLILIIHSPL